MSKKILHITMVTFTLMFVFTFVQRVKFNVRFFLLYCASVALDYSILYFIFKLLTFKAYIRFIFMCILYPSSVVCAT